MSPSVPHAASAVGTIVAPAATYSESSMDEADPRILLDEDLVAMAGQLVHADRRDGHAVLVVLDFLGDSDLHLSLLVECRPHLSCVAGTTISTLRSRA